jgi:hypothetical protein
MRSLSSMNKQYSFSTISIEYHNSKQCSTPIMPFSRQTIVSSCRRNVCTLTVFAPHKRTTTSTHGIRICFFSRSPLTSSNPLPLTVTFPPSPILLLTPSMATLASAPPVPLIAAIAMLAVSINVSASVALPLKYDDAVSEGAIEPLGHRGSNQSAWKSKREKTRTKRRMEQ